MKLHCNSPGSLTSIAAVALYACFLSHRRLRRRYPGIYSAQYEHLVDNLSANRSDWQIWFCCRVKGVERHKQFVTVLAVSALLGVALLSARAKPFIIYNPSASMPIGFYVRQSAPPRYGDAVTIRASDVAPAYAMLRSYNDDSDLFIKRVAASGGDEICAADGAIWINGHRAASRLETDNAGNRLPTWSGCQILHEEVLLLGAGDDSFDGRYWGPVSLSQIEGVWRRMESP
jgi:type IV secretory pathway protease TraF